MNLNVWSGTGRLTKDVQMFKRGEHDVATFTIACNGHKDEVLFLACDLWRPGAVIEYLQKGKHVAVTGPLKMKSFTDKEGQQRDRLVCDCKTLELLGSSPEF